MINTCSVLHEITHVRSRSNNLLDMSIVVLSSSFWWKWVPTTLVKSQWFLKLLSNQKPACPGWVWQKIEKTLTQDHYAVQGVSAGKDQVQAWWSPFQFWVVQNVSDIFEKTLVRYISSYNLGHKQIKTLT